MIATEDVLFIMPRDKEMQFCAMSALQRYVNDYEVKMQANCVTPTLPKFQMRYKVDMPVEDWQLFQRLGIDLKQQPEEIGFPDAVIELSDEKLLSLYNSEKHCSQGCSAIAGVETPPLPKVVAVTGEMKGEWLWKFADVRLSLPVDLMHRPVQLCGDSFEDVLWRVKEGPPWDGIIIGYQSWQTYAAAAMGLPVVEILQKNRSVNWLSKWKNQLYRIVEEDRLDRLPAALYSIERVMSWVSSQAQADKAERRLTVATGSIAPSAVSTSQTRMSR